MFLNLFTRTAWLCAVLVTGLLLQITVFPAVSQATSGQIYYMSPNGNDRDPGSLAQPFRTINRALKAMLPLSLIHI
jgi:hypothetical protein